MSQVVTCSCGQKFRVKQEHAGKRFECPACGKVITAPEPTGAADASPPPLKKSPPPRPPKRRAAAAAAQPAAFPAVAASPSADSHTTPAMHRLRERAARRNPWPWIIFGGGGAALLVAGLTAWALLKGPAVKAPASPEEGSQTHLEEAAVTDPVTPADLEAVAVTGSVIPADHTESFGIGGSSTYLRWHVKLELNNGTSLDVKLGKDIILVEASADGSSFEGVAQFRGRVAKSKDDSGSSFDGPDLGDCYGLSNFEVRFTNETKRSRRGSTITRTFPSEKRANKQTDDPEYLGFGTLPAGVTRSLETTLDQGAWLKDEFRASVRVVLPELQVGTGDHTRRARLIAYFKRTGLYRKSWTVDRTELIVLETEELAGLLQIAETNPVTRILAANWLAELDPKAAAQPLCRVARGLRQGELLACCLMRLTETGGSGLESHAVRLFRDEDTPNGIRRLAAKYLGKMRHEPALNALIAAVEEDDEPVASGAIEALAKMGGPRATAALKKAAEQGNKAAQKALQNP